MTGREAGWLAVGGTLLLKEVALYPPTPSPNPWGSPYAREGPNTNGGRGALRGP